MKKTKRNSTFLTCLGKNEITNKHSFTLETGKEKTFEEFAFRANAVFFEESNLKSRIFKLLALHEKIKLTTKVPY